MAKKMFLQQPRKSNHRDHQKPVVEPVKEVTEEERWKAWGEKLETKRLNRERNARPKVEYVRLGRGGWLIGSKRSQQYKPAWMIKEEKQWRLEWEMRHRADSSVADGTFAEFELGPDWQLKMAAKCVESKQPMVYIGGLDDRFEGDGPEGDEDEEMGLEDGACYEEDGVDDGNGHSAFELQIQHMLDEGFEVKGGEAKYCVGRRQSVRKLGWPNARNGCREACLVEKALVVEDDEDRRFDDPLGSLFGERLEWHDPNGFRVATLD